MPRKKKSGPLTPGITPPPSGETAKDRRIKEREETLSRWRARVARAQKIRKDWEVKFSVEKCENFMIGLQSDRPKSSDPVFNHTLATIKVIKPNVFYSNPKFYVRPKPGRSAPVDEHVAAVGEAILEAIGTQDNNFKNAASHALWQNFSRIAVLKVCYDPKMEPNPDAGSPVFLTTAEGMPMIDESTGQPQMMRDPMTGAQITEPKEIVTDEAYRYEWVDAANMLLPDEGPDQSKWSWVGEEVVVALEEAKEDSRFDPELRSQLRANESRDGKKRSQADSGAAADRETEYFRYFDCYDIKKKKYYIWADGQTFDDFLADGPLPPGVEDHPYAILSGWTPIQAPVPSPWPLPHILPWIDIQREYNIRRRQITEGAKRSARKGVYDDSTFADHEEAVKLLSNPDDMAFAKVNNVSKPPHILETPDINPGIYRDIPLLMMDWRIITGQTGAKFSDPDSNTATEASFVERASNLRDADMLDAVHDWLGTAGRKMLQRVKATLTLQMWVKMRGFTDSEFTKYIQAVYPNITPEMLKFLPGLKETFMERFGKEKWMPITRETLQFEAEVSVVPGSFRPRNLDVERSQWMQFLQVIGQFPQIALSRELMRETASKFEYISERMLDELTALAQQMIQVNANQAGRTQGGQEAGAGDTAQQGLAGMLSAIA